MVRALILNDTRRGSFLQHLGCRAVMDHLLYLCRQHGIDVIRTLPRVDAVETQEFEQLLLQVDLVLVNGEGTMHHDTRAAVQLSRAIIRAKAAGKKTVLLNALWQSNRAAGACLASLDFVALRDSLSAKEVRERDFKTAWVTADFSFYRLSQLDGPQLEGAERSIGPMVVDSVDETAAFQLRAFAAAHDLGFRVMQDWRVREDNAQHPLADCEALSVVDLKRTNLVISGRFHAVCFAMKYGVPFLALPSNSHKLEALLQDAGLPLDDFLLPVDWDEKGVAYWLDHAHSAWERHQARISDFATQASAGIEGCFGAMAEAVGARPDDRAVVAPRGTPRRSVRICYLNTWAKNLEDAGSFVARAAGMDLTPLVANPADASLMAKARLDCDWYAENARCFASMKHPDIEFLPAWVAGQPGLADLAQRPRVSGEERWLVTMGHQPQALGAVAGKVFSLLSRLGVRHLFYAFDEASRYMPCFDEIAPYLDVLIHDEAPLEEKGRARLKQGCRTSHRSWVANVVPGAVAFNQAAEQRILFLGSQLGLTPHRQRQIDFLKREFKDKFSASSDHSVSVGDRGALNRFKVGFCPEGRKFGTPAMSSAHTDRPFWSGCLGMVPVSEDAKSGGRLQSLHEAGLIMRYAHGDLRALRDACERALALPDEPRRQIYDHFNRHETVGTVVADAIAAAR